MFLFPQQPITLHTNPEKTASQLGWQIFFWMMFILLMLYVYIVDTFRVIFIISFYDYADFLFILFSTAGLFGFVYKKPVFGALFWRCFKYLFVIESIGYSVVLPMLGIKHFDQPFTLDINYFFSILCDGFMVYALHIYSNKMPSIWNRNIVSHKK